MLIFYHIWTDWDLSTTDLDLSKFDLSSLTTNTNYFYKL